jgi:hypothetical protein
MDIVIHATKDGYRTLFSTDDELAYLIAKDVRSGANNDSSLGNFAHAVFFTEKGCVFTKYIIVKDTQRSNALGFIAFSLFINNNKSLKGEDVESILDELSNKYSDKYILNSYLNRGEKNLIREDWNFINDILRKYNELDKGQKDKEFHSGIKEAAFIYYNNEVPLSEYFDKPLQEEYIEYKQVFFINTDLKGSQKNPLNILSNSGKELEGIDLKNEYYYLNNYTRSKEITIIANGKDRSDGKNNNSIRAKWQVEINYSKDERCFEPIQAKGTLSNPNSEIYKYLEVKNNQINIKYDAFNNPEPKIKTISIEIKDRKGNFIKDAEIQIGMEPWKRIQGHSFSCIFKGTEIINKYNILVKKDCYSGIHNNFVPEKATDIITINLEERNIIPINVFDEEKPTVKIEDFEVWTSLTNGYKKTNQLEFINEQILDSYTITIRKNDYQDKIIPDFRPYQQNKIVTTLLKKEIKNTEKQTGNYIVSAGNHGRLKNNQNYSSNQPDGSDVKDIIVTNKGYKFTHFLKEEDRLIAQYEKEKSPFKRPLFISGLVVLALSISFGFWSIFKTEKTDNPEINISKEIQNYTEGDSLLINKLNDYKKDLELHKPEVIEINRYKRWFMGSEKQLDSSALMNWRNDTLNINEAIIKRNLLNDKDFKKLKKLHFSSKQNNLKEAINKIDSTKYKEISKRLENLSDKTLSEISEDIKNVLKNKKTVKKHLKENKKGNIENRTKIGPKTSPLKEKPKSTSVKSIVLDSPDKNKNIEISNKLKGSSISIDELNNLKDDNPKFKNSIQLYIDFFDNVKKSDQKQDFDNLLQKIKVDKIFSNSELKSFLIGICSNSDSFEKFNGTSGKKKCKTLKTLKNLK